MRKKGKNLANPYLQKSYLFEDKEYNSYNACIFLSHISEDKEKVKRIGEYIQNAGFDIYLDIYDSELQVAADNGDHEAITKCIENGIKASTHIMCVISEETKKKGSWWVPYEIGFGKSSSVHVSSLLLKEFDTSKIPSYLFISDIIYGAKSLNEFLLKVYKESSSLLEKSYAKHYPNIVKHNAMPHPLDNYLDWQA
ncbi:toll/interleukin-1 receptor domain-containing protein [Alkalihalobacillus hwajinpoensis]|uniref:toll/interleukin-1 receptor domain-containing protein n=1 Tax=Guptibacillus hwajinpoensis TaxID=208199 RepID=UPI0018843B03|nr:toll/interleukin-1 receptor domain-containing protein [Pseudalkalibacillus hwajinpoensis]MBF0706026.1 toll/interleukin-1 receptor domain-containing protein [Pseudalkalibacillus hwajinpoensis]